MLVAGLSSVTFRNRPPAEVADLAARAGVTTIDWSGETHVPAGDLEAAARVRDFTEGAGLRVGAYSSTYYLGCPQHEQRPFTDVVATAQALGADRIKAWAGKCSAAKAYPSNWRLVAEEARKLADQLAGIGLGLSFECQASTLADTAVNIQRLLDMVAHPYVRCYWQPDPLRHASENVEELHDLLPRLDSVHVYYWELGRRVALSEGASVWRRYLEVPATDKRDHGAIIKFVAGDLPESFFRDTETLLGLIDGCRRART